MTAKKFTITTTFLLIATITAANALWPDSFLASFAFATPAATAVRLAALLFLGILMATNPPRDLSIRLAFGAIGAALLAVAIQGVSNYSFGLLDAILYVEIATILAIEALEFNTDSHTASRRIRGAGAAGGRL